MTDGMSWQKQTFPTDCFLLIHNDLKPKDRATIEPNPIINSIV
jgi:hypothetical protein